MRDPKATEASVAELKKALSNEGDHVSQCNKIVEEIKIRPNSDGTFLEHFNRLAEINKAQNLQLTIFKDLFTAREELREEFNKLVRARNILHHDNDEEPFLNDVENLIPKILRAFRRAFVGVDIIIPRGMFPSPKSGLILKASLAMGSHADLEQRDYTIDSCNPNDLLVDDLVAFKIDDQKSLRLTNFFVIKEFQTKRHDFGIFEKMKGSEAEYSFTHQ